MCGITGIYRLSDPLDTRWIKTMTDTLRHRGPDDEGYLLADTLTSRVEERRGDDTVKELWGTLPPLNESTSLLDLALGHRRLSIIDLSHHDRL
jgi:asparagine synthase (glutamine-hydrolysing)